MLETIVVGSTSRRKIEAVARALAWLRPGRHDNVFGTESASGVPETPWDSEILIGARNRAEAARRSVPEADLWIGLETGLVNRLPSAGAVFEETWCCVLACGAPREFLAYSSGVPVPEWVLEKMRDLDLAHCDAMTVIERELGLPNDTLGTYTGGLLNRDAALEEAVRNALASLFAKRNSQ